MLIANNTIFSSQAALNGQWRNISNWVAFSLQINGLEGNVWFEVSNDPNVLTDGANISAPSSAPTLSQYTPLSGTGVAGVPTNTTYYVKSTYITPNSLNPTGGVAPTVPGETTASAESSLLVTAGNLLVVNSPAPDAAGVAVGWNAYISTTSGTETVQNLYDNAIVTPLRFRQNFIAENYSLLRSTAAPPSSNTTAIANSGINIAGNLAAGSYTYPPTLYQMQIVINGSGQAVINPSGIVWNFIRVCKDNTANTKVTTAFLFGQQG